MTVAESFKSKSFNSNLVDAQPRAEAAMKTGPDHPVPNHVPAECVVDFDIYRLETRGEDFFEAWTSLQGVDRPNLVWTPRNGGHWIATRGSTILSLFDAPELSSRAVSVPREVGEQMGFIPLQSDPPEHGLYRAAVVKALDTKRVMALEPLIRESARELASQLRATTRCEFVREFAEVLPIHTFLVLVGLPPEDRPMLRRLGEQLNRPDGTMTPSQLLEQATEYLRPHVAARLKKPGEDLLSGILALPVGDRPWREDEAMRMCRNLLFGGLDTVAALLGFTMHFLAGRSEHRAALRDRPQSIPRAVAEFVRRFGPVAVTRLATTDFETGGVRIAAGDIVMLPTMLHNLDERVCPHAAQVDFDRGAVVHATMGHGRHRCVGATLAQLELRIVLEEWFRQIPEFTLDPFEPPRMRGGGVGSLKSLPLCLGSAVHP